MAIVKKDEKPGELKPEQSKKPEVLPVVGKDSPTLEDLETKWQMGGYD